MPKKPIAKPTPELARLMDAVAAIGKIEARRAALEAELERLKEARAHACEELVTATRGAVEAFALGEGDAAALLAKITAKPPEGEGRRSGGGRQKRAPDAAAEAPPSPQ
ncbi:MAG: hypothetical protein ACOY0T_37315 [Myxococcota bacterium]